MFLSFLSRPRVIFTRILLAMVLAALLCALSASRASAVQPGAVPDLTWYTPHDTQAKTAAALKDVGSRWVRLHVNWKEAEPSKGSWNTWWLSEWDQAIARARRAGQRVVVMVSTTPGWASESSAEFAPPRDPGDYARLMRFLANRWRDAGVDAYEVWNEPNIERFWATGPSPREYTKLLKAAYPAVKAGDPGAKVVFGGLSTNDYRFVEGAYAAGAKGYFDVMSTHPYSCANGPDTVIRESNGRMRRDSYLGYREIRASMRARGDSKPIWFTEFGWSTTSRGCGVSEEKQARYLKRALELAQRDPYVQVACWYNFRNNYWSKDADDYEARFGLLKTDFRRKRAYNAFKQFARPAQSAGATATARPKRRVTDDFSIRLVHRAPRWRRFSVHGQLLRPGASVVRIRLYRRTSNRWREVRDRRIQVRGGRFAMRLGRLDTGRWRVLAKVPAGSRPAAYRAKKFRVARP